MEPVLRKFGEPFVGPGCELYDVRLLDREGKDPITGDALPARSWVRVTVRRLADDFYFCQSVRSDMSPDQRVLCLGEFLGYIAGMPLGGWDWSKGEAELGSLIKTLDGREGVVVAVNDRDRTYKLEGEAFAADELEGEAFETWIPWDQFPAKAPR